MWTHDFGASLATSAVCWDGAAQFDASLSTFAQEVKAVGSERRAHTWRKHKFDSLLFFHRSAVQCPGRGAVSTSFGRRLGDQPSACLS